MSGTRPSFVFPSHGFPLPEPTSERASPASLQEQPLDRMLHYVESAIQDSSEHPSQGFGTKASSVRVRDIIEPRWTEPDAESVSGMSSSVYALQMFCLVCLPGGERAGYSWCDHDTSSPMTLELLIGSEGGLLRRGGADAEMQIPAIGSAVYLQNVSIVCTIGMFWSGGILMSQIFLVTNKNRTTALGRVDANPRIYNETYPLGYQNATTMDELFPLGYPTVPATPRISIRCTLSRIDNCRRDGWYGWPVGQKFGVIFGAVAGTALILTLIWCCCRHSKYSNLREKKKPILLSELRAQQDEEGRAHVRRDRERQEAEAQSIVERARDEREEELDVGKPPPAYHEAVNDQERMLATYAIRRDNIDAANPPPSYVPQSPVPNSTVPTPNTRPVSVANPPPPARAAYPQLPAAPTHHPRQ